MVYNISAISLASNPVFHARTKLVEVDYRFVREKVLSKDLQVHYVSSTDQVANLFTKGLHPRWFQYFRSKLKVTTSPFGLKGAVDKTVTPSTVTKKQRLDKLGCRRQL